MVLGYKLVASHDIALGRLVSPFGPELPLPGRSYHFVCARGQERRPAIKAFRDWLFAEIAEHLRQAAARTREPREAGHRKRYSCHHRAREGKVSAQFAKAAISRKVGQTVIRSAGFLLSIQILRSSWYELKQRNRQAYRVGIGFDTVTRP